jgi:hypothetical protein
MNKFKIYLKWFPICGVAFSSFEEEIKLKSGILYMIYQLVCCVSWFLILAYITRNY